MMKLTLKLYGKDGRKLAHRDVEFNPFIDDHAVERFYETLTVAAVSWAPPSPGDVTEVPGYRLDDLAQLVTGGRGHTDVATARVKLARFRDEMTRRALTGRPDWLAMYEELAAIIDRKPAVNGAATATCTADTL